MLVDKFVMMWQADTAQASKAVDDLQAKAKATTDEVAKTLNSAVKEINQAVASALKELSSASKDATKTAKDAKEEAKRAAKEASEAAAKAEKVQKQRKQTTKDVSSEEAAAMNGAAEANKNHTAQAGRMVQVLGRLRAFFGLGSGPGGAGGQGGGGRRGTSGGGIFGNGKFWRHINVGGFNVGALASMGIAAAAATVALMTFRNILRDAGARAEESLKTQTQSWQAARSPIGLQRQRAIGRGLGMSEDEVTSGLSGMADKLRMALSQPWGEEALRFRQSGIKVGTLANPKSADEVFKSVVAYMHKLSEAKGPAEATAWAVERMGMSFEMATRIARLTDSQIKGMFDETGRLSAAMEVGQKLSRDLAEEQRKLANTNELVSQRISNDVTPAMTKFTEKLREVIEKSGGTIDKLGKLAAEIVNLGTKALEFAEKVGKKVTTVETSDFNSPIVGFMKLLGLKIFGPTATTVGTTPESQTSTQNGEKPTERKEVKPGDNAMKSIMVQMKDAGLSGDKVLLKRLEAARAEAARAGQNDDQIKSILQEILRQEIENNKIAGAQARNMTPPIPIKPINIGMEQALSLWAAGLGQTMKLKAPESAAAAGTRSQFQNLVMQKNVLTRQVQYNGGLQVGEKTTQDVLAGRGPGTINLDRLVEDATKRLAPAIGNAAADAFRLGYYDPAAQHKLYTGVSGVDDAVKASASSAAATNLIINNNNNVQIQGSRDVVRDASETTRRIVESSTKSAVNAAATMMVK